MINKESHIIPPDTELTNFILGRSSVEQSEEIFTLIQQNNDIRKRYDELRESIDILDEVYLNDAFDPQKAKANFLEQIKSAESKKQSPRTVNKFYLIKIAATLILAFLPLWYFLTPKNIEITSSTDRTEAYLLPDNTKVWINGNSNLTYPNRFRRDKNAVELLGEAYFEVETNPQNPFTIQTESFIVKVIGTSFNLRNYPGEPVLILTVDEGVVEIFSDSHTLLTSVKQGEQLELNKKQAGWNLQNFHDPNHIAWKTGILEFNQTSLDKVIHSLSDFYSVKITICNDKLAEKQITSTFKNESLESVLEVMSVIHNLSIENNDSTILICQSQE